MCGISGFIINKKIKTSNLIDKTLKLMSRRGPDFQNYKTFKLK